MIMKNDNEIILAAYSGKKEIYFIPQSYTKEYDGQIIDGEEVTAIKFWPYVTRIQDLEIVDDTDYLYNLWHGDVSSDEWLSEYFKDSE